MKGEPIGALRRVMRTLLASAGAAPLLLSFGLVTCLLAGVLGAGPTRGPGLGALVLGSARVCSLALLIALPPALLAAVHVNEFASHEARRALARAFELSAQLPAVVFAFVGVELLAPWIDPSGARGQGLAALTLALMLAPTLARGSVVVLAGVRQSLREGAWALGAGRAQTVLTLVLPNAAPGLSAVVLLALARALGELVIVSLLIRAPLAGDTLPGFIAHSARALPSRGGPALFVAAALLTACTTLLGFGARRLFELQRVRGGPG